jgi:hypothetical protein
MMSEPIKPRAWLCELAQEDGTTRTQIVEQDPAGLNFNDAGEPSPYSTAPLYAMTPEDITSVNRARREKAWRARDTKCGCDHNEYCVKCFPLAFRKGGIWDIEC